MLIALGIYLAAKIIDPGFFEELRRKEMLKRKEEFDK